ncbi:hypothetical protein CGRA01v4_00670 [Colletotrichum graminicola]|uniref:Uncharacterized protein n=1 Tax=Colletotrichum graminicola (strain M1.001 / M2 / FGSC 10212) TaxID=645133 RepID=E3QMZ1_COLGM|nr:uncharacterized protein GLRG_07373 [Colletotrichum graminicola M1.001]EFQ32229.1 hypothetical protein GLRG_07373 [Colletotrichum graminicola M1.001]WDK09392.1 hypothetical protein CGRA01v4_00670 [Colletotrichum graminicola]
MGMGGSSAPGPLTSHPITGPSPNMSTAYKAQRPSAKRANSIQRANSRFVEGSMNDRTSAAPPIDFLGPEDSTEIARRFHMDFYVEAPDAGVFSPERLQRQQYHQPLHQHSQPLLHQPTVTYGHVKRPSSSSGSQGSKKGFWGGLREKLSFVRDKGARRPLSLDSKLLAQEGGSDNEVGVGAGAPPVMAPAGGGGGGVAGMPSREEIMASYQQLMKDGFFDAHAIRSTRQPPPSSLNSSTTMYSIKPPVDKKSFAERVSGQWPPPLTEEVDPLPESRDGNRKRGFPPGEYSLAAKKLRKSTSRVSVDPSTPDLQKRRSHAQPASSDSMPPPPPPNYLPPPRPPRAVGGGTVFVRRSFSNPTGANNRPAKHAQSSSLGPVLMDTDLEVPNPLYAASTRSSIDSDGSRRPFAETARAWTSRTARKAAEPLGLRPNSNHGTAMQCGPDHFKSRGFGCEGENHIAVQERELPSRWRGMRFT